MTKVRIHAKDVGNETTLQLLLDVFTGLRGGLWQLKRDAHLDPCS